MTDPVLLLQAALLGIIEGLTEFLPISSTGHLIMADWLIGFKDPTNRVFHVVIQLGAVLAICVLYSARLTKLAWRLPFDPLARRFALSLIVGFLPAAVLGVLFHDTIKAVLFSVWVVPVTLILGGIAILVIERRPHAWRHDQAVELPLGLSFVVGCCQALAMVPGVSRSGATILGGVVLGVERRAAAEFSFFLAIPTMLGATALDLYKSRDVLSTDFVAVIAVGFVAAFLSALLVVRAMMAFLARYTFEGFGWYRIAVGLVMLAALVVFGAGESTFS